MFVSFSCPKILGTSTHLSPIFHRQRRSLSLERLCCHFVRPIFLPSFFATLYTVSIIKFY